MANKSEWDKKFLREQPFMPFGSLMNAYCQVNQGKGITAEKLIEDADKIFDFAVGLVEGRFGAEQEEVVEPIEEIKNF